METKRNLTRRYWKSPITEESRRKRRDCMRRMRARKVPFCTALDIAVVFYEAASPPALIHSFEGQP
jgi:hypothetical protein